MTQEESNQLAEVANDVKWIRDAMEKVTARVDTHDEEITEIRMSISKTNGTFKGMTITLSIVWAIVTFVYPFFAR